MAVSQQSTQRFSFISAAYRTGKIEFDLHSRTVGARCAACGFFKNTCPHCVFSPAVCRCSFAGLLQVKPFEQIQMCLIRCKNIGEGKRRQSLQSHAKEHLSIKGDRIRFHVCQLRKERKLINSGGKVTFSDKYYLA